MTMNDIFINIDEKEKKRRINISADNFKENLKELRQEKHFTQKKIARRLGIAESTYANWEQGRTQPCIYDIFNLLFAFEIEANDLFDIKTKECKKQNIKQFQ